MKPSKIWMLTSILLLIPVVLGLLLWNQLPDLMPTHFGINGTADALGGKAFVVFGIPGIFFATHWLIFLLTRLDKQNRGHNEKVMNLIAFVIPMVGMTLSVAVMSLSLGRDVDMNKLMFPMLGTLFLILGNRLPKTKQNSTLGIKLPWTIYNEENWQKTHRFGGFVWVTVGILFFPMGFLPDGLILWLLPGAVLLIVVLPTVYSWRLAQKQKKAGTYTESKVNQELKRHPMVWRISLVALVLILLCVAVLMFTGSIEYTFGADALEVDASWHQDITVAYEQIDSVEFREEAPAGLRSWGYASAKLLLGVFRSEELGNYTRYTYTGDTGCVVLTCGEDILVLGAENSDATRALYEQLLEHIG